MLFDVSNNLQVNISGGSYHRRYTIRGAAAQRGGSTLDKSVAGESIFILILLQYFYIHPDQEVCSEREYMPKRAFILYGLLIVFCVLGIARGASADKVYDVQCGYLQNREHAEDLAYHLRELDLPWYGIPTGRYIRFIIDLNIHEKELPSFIARYPKFSDAFLVKNFWDIPRPEPETLSPVPTREKFVSIMAPYMQREYKRGCYNRKRLSMARERAEMYTRFIYDASVYYDLDPFLLFAVGNFETYFRNMYGDLDRLNQATPDPAQGMFQILRSTCRYIYDDMRKKNVPHAPAELPANMLTHPKTQIYFAAHYLHSLKCREYNNRYMALLAYNSSNLRNYAYARRVMRFYQKAMTHFITSIQSLRAGADIPVTTRAQGQLPLHSTVAKLVQ